MKITRLLASEIGMLNNFSDNVLAVDLGWVKCSIVGHHVDRVLHELDREAVGIDNVPVQDIELLGERIRG